MNPIRVVVAEDEYFTREGIASILDRENHIQVVAKAASGEEALRMLAKHDVDVLLLDIRMPPGITGIEVIERLRAENHPVRIIALTSDKTVVKAVQMAGANGFIPKDRHAMFLPAVRCVAAGEGDIFINPEISRAYRDVMTRVERAGLTPQEKAVWSLIAYKNEEIANRLHKAPGRIRNIITEIYGKLGLDADDAVSQRVRAMQMAEMLHILEKPEPPIDDLS